MADQFQDKAAAAPRAQAKLIDYEGVRKELYPSRSLATAQKDTDTHPPPSYESLHGKRHSQNEKPNNARTAIDIASSFSGYEEGMRKHLDTKNLNSEGMTLWNILKWSMAGEGSKTAGPISFNEPLSQLQREAEDLEYAELLNHAAELQDPTERMVHVAAFIYSKYASSSGLHTKPFNPLLGETFEYADPEKGYRFLAEQVSHHPPICTVSAESDRWTHYGESALKTKIVLKSFSIESEGTFFLKLKLVNGDTELYTWKKPTTFATVGMISGPPTVERYGSTEIKNHSSGQVCNMESWKMASPYEFSGKVTDADGKLLCRIFGRWKDKIYFSRNPADLDDDFKTVKSDSATAERKTDQKISVVWEATQRPPGTKTELTPFLSGLNDIPNSLQIHLPPTDTRLRPDQRALDDGARELAAAEKVRLEESQRERQRTRESSGIDHAPHWFKRTTCDITGEEYWGFDGSYWTERAARHSQRWKGVEDIFGNNF